MLIVEDSVPTALHLSKVVTDIGFSVVGMTKDADSTIEVLANEEVNVVLLDIKLANDSDGVAIGQYLSEHEVPFVYITANTDFSTLERATKTNPRTYLTKPFSKQDVVAALQIIRVEKEQEEAYVKVHYRGGIKKVYYNTILFIKASNVYIEIHTESKVYTERKSIKVVEEELPKSIFARVHRSYIVNKKKVNITKSNALVIGEHNIPVSKSFSSRFH